jgi:hypothetical protein
MRLGSLGMESLAAARFNAKPAAGRLARSLRKRSGALADFQCAHLDRFHGFNDLPRFFLQRVQNEAGERLPLQVCGVLNKGVLGIRDARSDSAVLQRLSAFAQFGKF